MANLELSDDDKLLTTISVKIPRWVEDEFRRVSTDADLLPGESYRIALSKLAEFFRDNWKRGPSLSCFLDHIEFTAGDYNVFFEPKR